MATEDDMKASFREKPLDTIDSVKDSKTSVTPKQIFYELRLKGRNWAWNHFQLAQGRQ
jgi:hypothetical protein